MEKKQQKLVSKIVVVSIIILALCSYFFIPSVKEWINDIIKTFATGDFGKVRKFVESYGAYAAVISFILMILQSLIAPLPAFLITFANANLFGWWQGAILSWSSAMVGAALCFLIARVLGRDVVEKLTSKAGLQQIDTFFERYGKHSILIARLLPFISFDAVSYAAGITSMNFRSFFIATGLGQLPATIVYSYVGRMLSGGAKLLVTGLLILFALTILIAVIRQMYMSKQKAKLQSSNESTEG